MYDFFKTHIRFQEDSTIASLEYAIWVWFKGDSTIIVLGDGIRFQVDSVITPAIYDIRFQGGSTMTPSEYNIRF